MMYDMNMVIASYEDITKKFKYDLDIEWGKGRIKGTEYADAYKALMDSAMRLAFQTPSLDVDVEIKEQQKLNLIKENTLLDAQISKRFERVKRAALSE